MEKQQEETQKLEDIKLIIGAAKHPIQQRMYRSQSLAKNNDVVSNHITFNISNLFSIVQKKDIVAFKTDSQNNIDVADLQLKKATSLSFEPPQTFSNCTIAYSGFKLSADLDQLVFFALLSNRKMHVKTSICELTDKVLGEDAHLQTTAKKRIVNSVIRLAYTNLTIQYKDLSLEDFRLFRFKIQQDSLEVTFDKSFEKLMSDDSSSQTYLSIKTLAKFESSYAKCLYPLLKTRLNISSNDTAEVSLSEIVAKLKAEDKNVKKTRERINIALREIQEKTDIYKNYSYKKDCFTFSKFK